MNFADLKEQPNLKRGDFAGMPVANLQTLAASMLVNGAARGASSQEACRAIPSPMAPAHVYREALSTPSHSSHAALVDEWRGAATLIAFAGRLQDRCRVEMVDLLGPRPLFAAVRLDLGEDLHVWNPIAVIKVQGMAVAFGSPWTWACVGVRSNVPDLGAQLPVSKDGRFQDPVPALWEATLRGDAAAATTLVKLLCWVREMWRQEMPLPLGRTALPMLAVLREQLAHWVSDSYQLMTTLPAPGGAGLAVWVDTLLGILVTHGASSDFEGLAPLESVPADRLLYRIRLAPQDMTQVEVQTRQGGSQRLLLDKGLPGHTPVFADVTIDRIDWVALDAPDAARTVLPLVGGSSQTLPDGWEWVRPGDLLAPTVARIPGWHRRVAGPAQERWASQLPDEVSVPLTRQAINLFPMDDLLNPQVPVAIVIRRPAAGETITATLKFRLSHQDWSLERQYVNLNKDDVLPEGQYRQLPADRNWAGFKAPVALWPNFELMDQEQNRWPCYELFVSNHGDDAATAENLRVLPEDAAGLQTHYPLTHAAHRVDIFRLKRAPRLLFLEASGQEAGCVPLQPLRQVPLKVGASCQVAVDFGTSSSTLAWLVSQSDSQPQVLSLDAVTAVLSRPNDEGEAMAFLSRRFRSTSPGESPLPTLLQRQTHWTPGAPKETLVVHRCAAHLDGSTKTWACQHTGHVLDSNLKWSVNPTEQELSTLFVTDLLLYVAATLANRGLGTFQVRWAYPSTLQHHHKGIIDAYFQEAITVVSTVLKTNQITAHPSPAPESVCVVQDICNQHLSTVPVGAGPSHPTVSIDIGAGTIDIAIWWLNQIQRHLSVRLGADSVLPVFLAHSPALQALLAHYAGNDLLAELALQTKSEERVKQAGGVLNLLFSSPAYAQKLQQAMGTLRPSNPAFQAASTLVHIYLSAVFYYTGMCLASCLSQVPDSLTLVLAGRGSTLLDWLGSPGQQPDASLQNMLRLGYGASLSSPPTFPIRCVRSTRLKKEVAMGLLSQDRLVQAVPPAFTVVGEDGFKTADGRLLSWHDDLDPVVDAALATGVPFVDTPTTLPQFGRFHAQLLTDIAARRSVLLPLANANSLFDHLQGQVQHAMSNSDTVDSPFIVAVRHLLQWSTDQLADPPTDPRPAGSPLGSALRRIANWTGLGAPPQDPRP